ncbi:MAG: Crp/Fnr family transcriptional regulator [Pseudobacter sp.]|uniref:Crp/Fnr family transcriptional regulator n=1 Tax=Pseudobacter sp. TaxID=2045420 RepID=UPI003F7D8131
MQNNNSIRQLFPGLEEELYDEMEQHGDIRQIPAGTVLLKKGQTIRSTMLILEGIVKLYQEDDNGSEFFMYDIEPGEACAVSMVCTYRQENSQVLAKAMTDVSLLSIPLPYMDEWLGKYKSWHYFVIRTWRARYEELLNTINEIAFKKMDERLEFYIKGQVEKMGRHIRLTHQEMATDLNSSREVISRLMKKMEKNGWVIIHRNSFEWIKS